MALARIYIVLFILLCKLHATAQYNRDSLLKEINRPDITDTQRVNLYNKIARTFFPNQHKEARPYLRKAISMGADINFKRGTAVAYHLMGISYHLDGNGDSTLYYLQLALPLYQQLKMKVNEASCLRAIGAQIKERGNLNKALGYFINAEKVFAEAGIERDRGYALIDIGMVYTADEQYDKALETHKEALALFEKLKDTGMIIICYENLGTVSRYQKNYKDAMHYDLLALNMSKNKDANSYNYSMHEIGTTYLFMKQYDSAVSWLQGCINNRIKDHDSVEIAYTYNYLGETYQAMNNDKKAEECYLNALQSAINIKNKKQELESYDYLSKLYDKMKEPAKAYEYLKLFNYLNDSIGKINKSRELAELQTQYETAKKEKEIEQQKFAISKRNYWIAGISGLLLLGGLLGFSSYRRYKLKQEARLQREVMKQQDISTRAVLEAEERERQRIARDLHDGIGQIMSVAKMNLAAVEDNVSFRSKDDQINYEKAIQMVDESCKEVRAVSHNIMRNTLLKAGLVGAIREFIDKINSEALRINLHTEGLNERLPSDTEIVLYRVIQECVNNVIKHAQANHLEISIIKDSDGISATIEDNSKGFDSSDMEKFKGIGLKNISTRIHFLKGTVDFDSAPGKGTLVAIHIPNEQKS
jgi:signal transduction histidine kinase